MSYSNPSPTNPGRSRANTGTSIASAAMSLRSATTRILDSDPPPGMWAATANATSKAPTLSDIRRGSFSHGGWEENGQIEHRRSSASEGRPVGRRMSSGSSAGRMGKRKNSTGVPVEGDIQEDHREDGGVQASMPMLGDLKPLTEEPSRMSREERRSRDMEPFPEVTRDEMLMKEEGVETTDMAGQSEIKPMAQSSGQEKSPRATVRPSAAPSLDGVDEYPNGYIVPPKKPWAEATIIGLKGFWRWFCTPLGFLITLYGLNVVAWGGMLFLLLCGAAPAMCSQNTAQNHYDGCNDIDSPRRKWLEVDSQILNALFCVTGFGLIPWRFRDLYWLMRYRLCSEKKRGRQEKMVGLRRLAGIHKGWFRLPGSDTLDEVSPAEYQAQVLGLQMANGNGKPSTVMSTDGSTDMGMSSLLENDERLPIPVSKTPGNPLTGVRASPTPVWKMDFVIWCNVWNTFLQTCLCGFMWGMNRYTRPSWSTGLFIALACIIAGIGGIMMFHEGKAVKRVEGVPVKSEERIEDTEAGLEMQNPERARSGSYRSNKGQKNGGVIH